MALYFIFLASFAPSPFLLLPHPRDRLRLRHPLLEGAPVDRRPLVDAAPPQAGGLGELGRDEDQSQVEIWRKQELTLFKDLRH